MDSTRFTSTLLALLALYSVNSTYGDSANKVFLNDLKHFNQSRHHVIDPDGKTRARDYIRDTFVSLGLHTWMESFDPRPPNVKVTKGVNVVAMLPGRLARTRDDRIILIGSHYDTMRTSNGADDNGSGVVTLLQVARLLTSKYKSGKCQHEYSVMFVAFDFEEWEDRTLPSCACAEIACGSRAFVANFSQYYNLFLNMSTARYGQLQGAIIMDTMMNYNSTPYSQSLPPHAVQLLKNAFPEVYRKIKENKYRGDFLIAVGRYADDDQLLSMFSFYYNKDSSKYGLHVFRLPFHGRPTALPVDVYNAVSEFLRSDHISFWNEITSNRAIFLSDTANMRSYMRKCYHKNCDSLSHVTDDFLGFLSKSCDAIVMTTTFLIYTKCKTETPPAEESSELPAIGSIMIGWSIGTLMTALAVQIYGRKKKENDEMVANEEHNWSAANPVYAAKDSETAENNARGTVKGNINDNVYDEVEDPGWRFNGTGESGERAFGPREPGKREQESWGPGTREKENDFSEGGNSIA